MTNQSGSILQQFSARFGSPAAVAVLLIVHAALLLRQSAWNSPTLDEVGHLPAGMAVWEFGRFDLYRVNPPLVKSLAAFPAVIGGAETDWSRYYLSDFGRPEWSVGRSFIAANSPDWFRWFRYARWAVIPLSLLGALVCYCWARELYGSAAGLIALALWCFSPNILAWGATITPDLGATSLGLLAAWLFWRWLRTPEWSTAFLAGLALGLAELAKMTWVFLFLLWPVLWIVWSLTAGRTDDSAEPPSDPQTPRPPSRIRQVCQLTFLIAMALYVLNVGYAFDGTFQKLGDYTFGTRLLAGAESRIDGQDGGNRFVGTWLEDLPMPVPREYLRGMDLQWLDFERKKLSYLNGEWKEGGWWYYYLEAIALKVPLGTWIIAATVCGYSIFSPGWRSRWRDEIILLAPALAVFVLVSSQTGFSRYLRYVLPSFPFVFIWCGKAALTFRNRQWWAAATTAAALLWSIWSSMSVFPHSMSYFNELAGGPEGGHRYLLDANIDWGQDLFYLQDWYDAHPEARPIVINTHNFVDVSHFGMETTNAPSDGKCWYAISVHRLFGKDDRYQFLWKDHVPIAKAGYSIWIYHVPEPAD